MPRGRAVHTHGPVAASFLTLVDLGLMPQYHGGTNFGRSSVGPFTATSYDYDGWGPVNLATQIQRDTTPWVCSFILPSDQKRMHQIDCYSTRRTVARLAIRTLATVQCRVLWFLSRVTVTGVNLLLHILDTWPNSENPSDYDAPIDEYSEAFSVLDLFVRPGMDVWD
jgi:hypothetical protein